MWKYVSRRIRDVCDRTYNVLDVRRPWQCGGERFCVEGTFGEEEKLRQRKDGDIVKGSYCPLKAVKGPLEVNRARPHGTSAGHNSSEWEGFRRKDYCPFQYSWIGAITWTSAIICGWYTSQLICLYRRNHKWEGPRVLPSLISSVHRIPGELKKSCIFNYCAVSALPVPPIQSEAQLSETQTDRSNARLFGFPIPTGKPSRLPEFDFSSLSEYENNRLFCVNDERDHPASKHSTYEAIIEQKKRADPPTVDSAFENLLSVIGEIEYQLGVDSLEKGHYATAVSHLKLGASHQHAGAAFNLGICYEQGFGVKKNARVAMECYHLASTLGHSAAMYNLGVYYARGLGGLRRSRTMAKKYFLAAAELGSQEAIAALGYKPRRESFSAGQSTSVAPIEVPSDLKVKHYKPKQYDIPSVNQMDNVEMRLVSIMA